MLIGHAQEILGRILAPVTLEQFANEILGKRPLRVEAALAHANRQTLLGADPEATLLADFDRLSGAMTFHAADARGAPPVIEHLDSQKDFLEKIRSFHERGYTVRLPKVRKLDPNLDEFLRALETLFHKPADVEVFWSRSDAKAPVHHDDYDLIAVQLKGRKRWFVSSERSELPNVWKTIPKKPETLQNPMQIDMEVGDLLYLPRGTVHSVEGLADSIHLSIGFIPVTLREAVIACLDQLSEFHRPLRETVGVFAGIEARTNNYGHIPDDVRRAIGWLTECTKDNSFVAHALQRRSARFVGDLDKLPMAPHGETPLAPATRLRHADLALAHLSGDADRIDFAYPGGHHYVHRGAEQSVLFIASTPEFQIQDMPGDVDSDVGLALVRKLLTTGFLELVPD